MWPFRFAARLAEELCSLLAATYHGFVEPADGEPFGPRVLCRRQDCSGDLGTLAQVCDTALATVAATHTVKCPACHHHMKLRPYVGLATGATNKDSAALDYWLAYLSSEKVDVDQVRELRKTLVDVLLRWAPPMPDIPRLWVAVAGDGAVSTHAGVTTPVAQPSSPPLLRPVCAHPDCLHAVATSIILTQEATLPPAERLVACRNSKGVVSRLKRVAKAVRVCACAQGHELQTAVPNERLQRGMQHMEELLAAQSQGQLRQYGDAMQVLQDVFGWLQEPLDQVQDGESRELFVCKKHRSAYMQHQRSFGRLWELMQATRSDVVATRTDVAATRTDVAATRTDVAATRTDVAATRTDVAATRDAVDATRDVVDAAREDVSATRDEVSAARDAVSAARDEVGATREDVADTRDAVEATRNAVDTVDAAQGRIFTNVNAARNAVDALRTEVHSEAETTRQAVVTAVTHVKRVLLNHAIAQADRGAHPALFVLLPSERRWRDTLTARDTYHLYLLCEHEGCPHPLRTRDGDPRRSVVSVSKEWLTKLLPIMRVTLFALKVAGIVVKGVSTLAEVGEATLKELE